MKKLYVMLTVFVLSLTVGVTAMAQAKKGLKESDKPHCSSCDKSAATPEKLRKFKADSIDLRQELTNKRFDLQRENLKETPDNARITAIKAEIEAIKVKLDALKAANKIPASASCCNGDCPLMDCNCCDKCGSGKSCDINGKKGADCSKCNKTAGCGCKDCAKKGSCGDCGKASDCSCDKKKKGDKKN
jgi:hypothetical protein